MSGPQQERRPTRGKLIMSCGCEETDERPGFFVSYGTYDTFSGGEYGPCVAYAHMCDPCIKRLAETGAPFFSSESEGDEWLSQRSKGRDE